MRKVPIVTGQIYHVFNRGVNRGDIFFSPRDYRRFLETAIHYKTKSSKFTLRNYLGDPVSPGGAGVEILAYCLMPNHFHFLIKQLVDGGITWYMQHLSNSYSHYINTKYKRTGPLFGSRFKNVLVETDEQLLHVSRYIHLNPLVSNLETDLQKYPWSSYLSYFDWGGNELINSNIILSYFNSPEEYHKFVLDQADYGRELEKIKHLTIDHD